LQEKEIFCSLLLEIWSAYIDNFGGFALLARVDMQIIANSIIHRTVELHLRSFLHNNGKLIIIIMFLITQSVVLSTSLQHLSHRSDAYAAAFTDKAPAGVLSS